MVLVERDRDNRRLGECKRSVAQVRRARGRFSVDALADVYYLHMDTVKSILEAIDAHPDWDDETVAENVDFE